MTLFIIYILCCIVVIALGFIMLFSDAIGIVVIFFGATLMYFTITGKTVKTSDPIEIRQSVLSILIDDNVAIIRYDGTNHTYNSVRDYTAIKNNNFKFMTVKEYNILNNEIDATYKLVTR